MRRSPLFVVFFTVFLDLLGFGIVIPVAPYFARAFHATAAQVGLMGTLYSLMQFFFAPVWGRISDRVGRRPIILLSVFGSFLSYLLFGFANSMTLLLLSRALAGIMAANLSTAQAYVADVTTPENRARGMGMVGAALGLGFIFGPILGFAVSRYSYKAPIFLAAGLSLLDFCLALALLPESHRPERAPLSRGSLLRFGAMGTALRDPGLGPLVEVYFLSTLGFAAMEWMLPLFLKEQLGLARDQAYMVFAYVGIVVALVQGGLVGRLAKRGGEARLIVAGTLMQSAGLALIPASHSLASLLLVLALLALGNGITSPSVSSLVSRLGGTDEHGARLGITQGFSSLARAIGPSLGGYLYDLSRAYPFLAGGLLMLAAFLISFRLPARARPEVRDA